MKIENLDLNQLLVLHSVLATGSVRAAATRLHVTSSAVSNALARLRGLLGDPLLVRSGRGLVATPRAQALAPALAEAMASLERVVAAPPVDPRDTDRELVVACSDADQIGSIPVIVDRLARVMPRARLRVVPVDQLEAAGGLAAAPVDVAFGPPHSPTGGIHAADLLEAEAALVVRADHPRVGRTMTAESFNTLGHVDVHLALGRGGIGHRAAEEHFARHGLRRQVRVVVPSFTAAVLVAARTDLVAGVPRHLAESLAGVAPLRVLRPPGPPMRFRLQLLWHERTHHDPVSALLREVIVAAIGSRPPPRRGQPTAKTSARTPALPRRRPGPGLS